jgi:hypothetical protein
MRRQIRKRPRLGNGAQSWAGETGRERHSPVGERVEQLERGPEAEAEVAEAVGLSAGEAGWQ